MDPYTSEDQDSDAISAFADLAADMEKMAATMTNGANKMLKPGWGVVILAVPEEFLFHLSMSAPKIPGVQEIQTDFPSILKIKLGDLPTSTVEDFKAFMEARLDEGYRIAEDRMSKAVVRRELLKPPSRDDAKGGGWYEATGKPRGPLSQAVVNRQGQGKSWSESNRAALEAKAKERRDNLRAEREAINSILHTDTDDA